MSTKLDFLVDKNNKNNNHNNNHNDSKHVKPVFETPEFQASLKFGVPEFQDGINYGLSLVQIALYKMWDDKSILDFDSISDGIGNNIIEIIKNPETLKKWNDKCTEYLNHKSQGNSENDYD